MSMLNIAVSGLNASQIALNVASNNIANVNTPGYSRQEAQFSSLYINSPNSNGLGVGVSGVRRIADQYLNAQLWRSSSASGFNSTNASYLNTIEQVVGSDAMRITSGLDNFFAALSSAAEAPESSAPRQEVISSAQALAGRFNQLTVSLNGQSTQLSDELSTTVTQLNSQLSVVAELNKKISEMSAQGYNTAQLEDNRDQAVQELSGLVDIRSSKQSDGTLSLSLSQGQPLVIGSNTGTLTLTGSDLSVTYGTQTFPVKQALQGSLGGLISYRDNVLSPALTELNSIAKKFADEFNTQQAAGFDINTPRTVGKPLFTYDASSPSLTIQVVSDFKPDDLAFGGASGGAPVGGKGDNTNLLAMLKLKDNHYDAYSELLGDLAVKSGQAKLDQTASQQLQAEVKSKVNSVSGVNLDEEGVSIMQYSKSYQANAKVITTANTLFDTVLGMF